MRSTRGNVTRTEEPRMEVLGLISVSLPGPWWWHTEDMNDPKARGAIFRCYEEGNEQELAYLLIADVSTDPDEPDVALLEQSDIQSLDNFFEREVRHVMARDGRELLQWSARFSEPASGRGLASSYLAKDHGRVRQYIDLRISVDGRKVVIGGCYDVQHSEELAKPITWALQDAALNGRLR
jgi:hypothetical protein